MDNQEYHNYKVISNKYVKNEIFVKTCEIIVAHNPEEANDIAFRKLIIVDKIKDLGKVTQETMRL